MSNTTVREIWLETFVVEKHFRDRVDWFRLRDELQDYPELKDAKIYQWGTWVVYLVTPDNQRAKEIAYNMLQDSDSSF